MKLRNFFKHFWRPVFSMFFGHPFFAFWTPKGTKEYPLKAISNHFGGTGGNVKTMVSCTRNHYFHGWRESPETPEAFQKAFQKVARNTVVKHMRITENGSQRDLFWRPKGDHKSICLLLFRFGLFRNPLGGTRVAK